MENFNLNQLTKEMVVYRLKELIDPCIAASDIAQKTLLVALKDADTSSPAATKLVSDVCQGAMTGLILSDQNLAKGAVCILHGISEAAHEIRMDPTKMMQEALRGIAETRKYLRPEQMDQIMQEISACFLGAGDFLLSLLREPEQLPQPEEPAVHEA